MVKPPGGITNMKKIYKLILLPILLFGVINYIYSTQKDIVLKTNINTQHNSIVEFYKYINLLTSAIPEGYLNDQNRDKIIEDLSYRTKNYNSEYSLIEFVALDQNKKENQSALLGKYLFTFNPNKVHFVPLKGDKSNIRQSFKCEINIYLSENYITNQIPICNYNQDEKFNLSFNEKIKESIILSHINSLIFSYKDMPLKIPEKGSIVNTLSVSNGKNNKGNIIKEIKIINLSEEEHELSKKYSNSITLDMGKIEKFKSKNKILNIRLSVALLTQYEGNKMENCFLDLYQPWYMLLPDTLYSSVDNCVEIKN